MTGLQHTVLSSQCIGVLLNALQAAEAACKETNGDAAVTFSNMHDLWSGGYRLAICNSVHMRSLCAVGSLHFQAGTPTHASRNLTQPCCAELAAMRSLYAAVQLLLSRLLDFVASTQRAPAADSEGSAASMSRDRTSGDFFASPVIAAMKFPGMTY